MVVYVNVMATESKKKGNFLVFYGFAKLTKKIVRKKSIIIQYANIPELQFNERQEKYINQKMHIVYQRYQTEEEIQDAAKSNRSWTKWEYFVDDKKWKNSIDLILQDNFYAEENHVSLKERELIKKKLENEYYRFYGLTKERKGQQVLIFNFD